MIPDVTPNGVFYLPPTGWLTSFYNPASLRNAEKSHIFFKQPVPDILHGLLSFRLVTMIGHELQKVLGSGGELAVLLPHQDVTSGRCW